MVRINGLPVYAATLAFESDGVLRVSLVDDPAVQSNFDVFRAAVPDAKAPALYAVADEDRHLVRGVVLRADFPIFRRDTPEDPGYYVIFSAGQIRAFAEQYLAASRQNAVDTDHDGQEVDGVQMVQYFIKDTAAGIAPEGFDDIADGSLFAEYHVTNEDVWDEVRAGTYKGFSVEIFYTLVPMARTPEDDGPTPGLIDRIFSKIQDMKAFEKFKARLAALLAEPEQFGSVTTDKGVIVWDGDEDLKAGDRVQVEDTDGNRSDAPDGEYVTGDGKTIVVVDAVVSEIRDPEAEVAPAEEQPEQEQEMTAQQMAAQHCARFEESYNEKEQHIIDAIRSARGNDEEYGYLADAGDDFAVYSYYNEETGWAEKYVRYSVTWNEDGSASVSDPKDCRLAFVPMDYDAAAAFNGTATAEAEAQMEAALSAAEQFKAEAATLRARVAELEGQPAGHPAHESFRGNVPDAPAGKTGVKGLDRLASLMKA